MRLAVCAALLRAALEGAARRWQMCANLWQASAKLAAVNCHDLTFSGGAARSDPSQWRRLRLSSRSSLTNQESIIFSDGTAP